MGNEGQQGWLRDIRDYWSRLNARMAEEPGPGGSAREIRDPKRRGHHTPLPTGGTSANDSLRALSQESK